MSSPEQIAGRLRERAEWLLRDIGTPKTGRELQARFNGLRILELCKELDTELLRRNLEQSVGNIVPFDKNVRLRHETPHVVEVSAPGEGA